ncbi:MULTISPECIES: hypothetical protein [unclassified Acidovorax]|uniref:hypothetical protein n=1 Tax=unclassified Acidovorax TaxID=2684926 RepID=UPI0023DE54D0|nr:MULTISPECIES: hypothetical protein [unclassified Acidovorax]GKS84587.1 hypothetical protein AVMA1855_10565 [Acidovorax sp. SUPP1855]GKS95784.1 hypothetical protein AVAK2825_14635 [Acidovorax sp. SUPP2825]
MRMGFGLVALLVALAIVGLLVKKQLGATRSAVPVVSVPGAQPPASGASAATVREQSQQVQQQVKQQMEALMQQARPMPEDESK